MADASPVQACGGVALEGLGLYEPPRDLQGQAIDWGAGIRKRWDISEAAALQLLDRFLATGLQHYEVSWRLEQRGCALLGWGGMCDE